MLNRMPDLSKSEPLQGEQSFDLREAINFVWRQWKLIAGVTALGLVIGAIYLARQVPVYTANVQVLLDPRQEHPVGKANDVLGDVPLDMATIDSEIAVIQSTVLLTRVVKKDNLVNDPEFGAALSGDGLGLLASIRGVFSRDPAPASLSKAQTDTSAEATATVEHLKDALKVTRTGQAYLLNIAFTSADPAKAAHLANAIADAYLVDKLDARFEAAKRASGWLSDRLDDLRKQLRTSEEAVAQFRAAHNLVQTNNSATLTQDQLGQLNARLVSARADAAEKKAKVDLLDKIQKQGGSILTLPDVVNSGTIAQLRSQDDQLSQQEADLRARYNDRYPAVVNIRAQRADIQRAIAKETARIAANIRNDYALAKARQEAVEKTLQQVTGQNDLDANAAITLRELERTAAVNKTLFEQFLERARITKEQSTFEARDARIITPAVTPSSPSAPKKGIIFGAAGLIGLMCGVGAAYLLELLNAGFKTPREIESLLELPLLGSVSRMDARELAVEGKAIAMPLYPAVKPLSRFSESIRTIRSGIMMADVDDPPKVLQVTSTVPGEGKSTIALTLATSAAQSGGKVLMIDCDLRHPSSSKFFGLEREAGLVDYLAGQADIRDVIRYQEEAGYWVLPAGAKTQNPPDLLGSEKLKILVAQLREKFDLIILDSPPMGPVIDPVILSALADKILFVVRWAATAREMVQRAISQLPGTRKVAGVVFNMVNDAEAAKYGKYATAYYYGGRYYKKYYTE